MKSKKRKVARKSEDNTTTTSSSSLTKKILFWGIEDLDRNIDFAKACWNRNISCFLINISIDLKRQLTDEMNDFASFNHNCLHSHIEKIGLKETTLTPLFTFPNNSSSPIPPFFNTFATLDPFVYSIRGIYREDDKWQKNSKLSGSNLVYYFDTRFKNDHKCSWKQAPSMITHRQNPQVITANGKIFVFGCFGELKCPHNPVCCVWAEFFDPSTSEWSSISVPKFKHSLVNCSPNNLHMTHVAEKISAVVDYNVYQLDVKTKNWNCIANLKNRFGEGVKQLVLVRNILYWVDHNTHAYDTVKDESFTGPVQDFSFQRVMRRVESESDSDGEQMNGEQMNPIAILHLGGRYFCLLAYLPDLEEENPKRIHCLIIKISRTNESYNTHCGSWDVGEFFLGARVISCQSFPIDRRLNLLDGRIMMG